MGTRARAAVLEKPHALVLRDFPLPAIGPDEALLRVEACGICGTDYEQLAGEVPPHDYYTSSFPVIPGHELHTHSFPVEQAEQAIATLAGKIEGTGAIHVAIVPGVPPIDVARSR
jgi:D-arabinose 1-dehydrogenase-like Zn-dependent alcohol dehydrogenase